MTLHQPTEFSVTSDSADPRVLRLMLLGDLDYDTGGEFLDAVHDLLAAHAERYGPSLRHLHLDCADLGLVDSSGLSALLALRRHTHPAGITLHLRHEPGQLDRMLRLTGTAGHLTEPADGAAVPLDPAGELADGAESTLS